jgi:hypothetical protein
MTEVVKPGISGDESNNGELLTSNNPYQLITAA